MTKAARWPGWTVRLKLVFTSAPIVNRPRYVRSKSKFSVPARLKLAAARSTEAMALKQRGGSNTLATAAPSANESVALSVEQSIVDVGFENESTYCVERLFTVPNPDSRASRIATSISVFNFSPTVVPPMDMSKVSRIKSAGAPSLASSPSKSSSVSPTGEPDPSPIESRSNSRTAQVSSRSMEEVETRSNSYIPSTQS